MSVHKIINMLPPDLASIHGASTTKIVKIHGVEIWPDFSLPPMWPTVFQFDFEAIGDDTSGALSSYFDLATTFLVLEYNGDDAFGGYQNYFDTETTFLVLEYNGDDTSVEPVLPMQDSYVVFSLDVPDGDDAISKYDSDNYDKLLLHFNGNYTDTSTIGNTVTNAGNGMSSLDVPKVGTHAVSLNSTYISIPSSSDFQFGSGDFTIEFWVFTTSSAPAGGGMLFYKGDNNWVQLTGVSIFQTASSNTLGINVSKDGVSWFIVGASCGTLTYGVWNHVAVTRNGGTLNVWLNGSNTYTNTGLSTDSLYDGSTRPVWIGYGGSQSNTYFSGMVDEFRVTKGLARYTDTFTPSTTPFTPDSNTKLLLHFDGNGFTDASNSAHVITTTARCVGNERMYGTASAFFSGTATSYLTVPDSTNFEFGSGPFTIEFWVYYLAWSGGSSLNCPIGKCYNDTTTNPWYFELGNGAARFYYYNSGWLDVGGASSFVALNTWTHVAVVRNSNNVIKLYVNGNAVGTTRTYSGDLGNNTSDVSIGSRYGGGSWSFRVMTGYLDELRVSKGIARWSNNFIPPIGQYQSTVDG